MSDLKIAISIVLAGISLIIYAQALVYWCTNAYYKARRDNEVQE